MSFLSIIAGSSNADAKLSDIMKASKGPLYPSSAPNRRIIGRWNFKPPGYSWSRAAQALGTSGDGELVKGGLEASASLNFTNVFGLGGVGKQGKVRMN